MKILGTFTVQGEEDVIDADNIDLSDYDVLTVRKKPVLVRAIKMSRDFTVTTLSGKVEGKAGDYLMIGTKGEKYPCKKDIFEKTYEIIRRGR